MGVRFNKYTASTLCKVENKKLYAKYFDGKWYSVDIDIDYDFKEDSEIFYDHRILAKLRDNDKVLIVRQDTTYSIYRESDKLLLDIGSVDLSGFQWIEHYYKPICFKANNSKATTIYLDVSTGDYAFEFHETLNKPLSVYRVIKPLPKDIDLTLSLAEAEKALSVINRGDISMCSYKQYYDWREYLYEVSSPV